MELLVDDQVRRITVPRGIGLDEPRAADRDEPAAGARRRGRSAAGAAGFRETVAKDEPAEIGPSRLSAHLEVQREAAAGGVGEIIENLLATGILQLLRCRSDGGADGSNQPRIPDAQDRDRRDRFVSASRFRERRPRGETKKSSEQNTCDRLPSNPARHGAPPAGGPIPPTVRNLIGTKRLVRSERRGGCKISMRFL